jgi:hypothetical protein
MAEGLLPKAATRAEGPGGYPLAIKNIYKWMTQNQDLPGKKP